MPIRRALTRFALACLTAALVSGCALLPQLPGAPNSESDPAAPFGDFTLTRYASGNIWNQLRVFTDGAGVLLNISGGTGGMLEPDTMDRLRSLVGSAEFQRDLTRPLDEIESQVCTDGYPIKDTFRMGDLTADLPCSNHDRPALDEFQELLQPYLDSEKFAAKLPSGQPDLPTIRVHEESDGKPIGSRYELRPDGTILETDGSGEQSEVTIVASALDALHLILRSEPCASKDKPSISLVYVVQVDDRETVEVSQSKLDLVSDCLDYQVIAYIVAGPL